MTRGTTTTDTTTTTITNHAFPPWTEEAGRPIPAADQRSGRWGACRPTSPHGTLSFSSSDPTANLPKKYTFTASDQGVHTFNVLRLKKKGEQTITVTDTLNGSLSGSATIDVIREPTKTITIEVKGDSKRKANETFYLDLFGNPPQADNSLFTNSRGIGTILNDD